MRVVSGKDFITIRKEFGIWLNNYKWDIFVTLASNDPMMGEVKALDKLKAWDARINRAIAGPNWYDRVEDRLWGFFFLEKANANAHWHGLIRFMNWYPGQPVKQMSRFEEHCATAWNKLVPSGSVDIKPVIHQAGITSYVAKSVPNGVSYAYYVVPDEFR